LIEVMGLAVLPGRLKKEMEELAQALVNQIPFEEYPEELKKHAEWAEEIARKYEITKENIEDILHHEIGIVFSHVLEDAGVYKNDEQGRNGFIRFLTSVQEDI